ncbi:hypothetical protein Leryth_007594 [Lithospermum erythrorhizon]|nr:hypothetical protein Leryth_007594 [Lithospermum erythrorhizon]
MAQVLRQCPGILVLDEGHNPRSTKSRLRKALMKVNTKLRVLLSGTLFQNNFGEYFNTLCLARPNFVSEVLKVLDPKYKRRKKDEITRFSREIGRKYFIDKGILLKLQNQRPEYKGFPLELELLITLGAIHPWLIRTTACSSQYFSESELESLEQFKV